MTGTHPETAARQHQAVEVLLSCLEAAGAPVPGADGLTVEDILLSYPQAATAGLVPDRQQLLQLYPELSDLLLVFFADPIQSATWIVHHQPREGLKEENCSPDSLEESDLVSDAARQPGPGSP